MFHAKKSELGSRERELFEEISSHLSQGRLVKVPSPPPQRLSSSWQQERMRNPAQCSWKLHQERERAATQSQTVVSPKDVGWHASSCWE